MPIRKDVWICDICGREYRAEKDAIHCEGSHPKGKDVIVTEMVFDAVFGPAWPKMIMVKFGKKDLPTEYWARLQ